jgi:hypothetical protein
MGEAMHGKVNTEKTELQETRAGGATVSYKLSKIPGNEKSKIVIGITVIIWGAGTKDSNFKNPALVNLLSPIFPGSCAHARPRSGYHAPVHESQSPAHVCWFNL